MIKGRIKIPSTYSRSSLVIALQNFWISHPQHLGPTGTHLLSKEFPDLKSLELVTESSVNFPTPSILFGKKTETCKERENICNRKRICSREPTQNAMWLVNSRSKGSLVVPEGSNSWSLQDLQKSPQNWHCYIVPRHSCGGPMPVKTSTWLLHMETYQLRMTNRVACNGSIPTSTTKKPVTKIRAWSMLRACNKSSGTWLFRLTFFLSFHIEETTWLKHVASTDCRWSEPLPG